MEDLRPLDTVDEQHLTNWPWGLSFQMQPCLAPAVIWSNRRLPYPGGHAGLLQDCAWQVPITPTSDLSTAPRKTFYAECYGGDGVQNNGGGVRGAWHGDWLIKGIGINLLSGYSDEAAANRYHGRASDMEMLVEAVWGEVLHYALPYGAVRMTAVIRTGEILNRAWNPNGALGVRQFARRPAHFMRAPAFRARPENRDLIPHDTLRVKQAIAELPGLLPMPANLLPADIAKLKPGQRLTIGLEEMVRRFGEQMAAAKARRLSHGTLNTSNVALDGRWNDLNTVSALPGYGYRRNLTPFWQEQFSLLSSIDLLCFYVKKYFRWEGSTPDARVSTKEWLTAAYERFYTDALQRRFVALCGYPQCVADRIWSTHEGQLAMRKLAQMLIELAHSGHSQRRPYPEALHESCVRGDYDLMKLLGECSAQRDVGGRGQIFERHIGNTALRNDFSHQYRVVEKMMFKEAKRQGLAATSFARLVAINCHKAGTTIPLLYGNLLAEKCAQLLESQSLTDDVQQQRALEIEALIDQARMVYQEPRSFKTLLWCAGQSTLEFDARSNTLTATTATSRLDLPCSRLTWGEHHDPEIPKMLQSMLLFWGTQYEEIMQ